MMQRWILTFGSIWGICLAANSVNSQIVTDNTTNTIVLDNCQNSCSINGGKVAGQNLFHSFQEFNIPSGGSVYFADPGVANIFSRVTGSNPSQLLGTLGISGGDANLFLINPNGIVFGEGATLDLNGSFFATTADKIQFGDRIFSTDPDPSENIALLTVNPSAMFFNQVGQNGSIILEGADLTLTTQKDLALLGQEGNTPGILIKNSQINVVEGNVALGAVKNGGSIGIEDNLQLQFPEDVIKGDIILTETSRITATTLGNVADQKIEIDAGNLEIIGSSNIFTFTAGIESSNGAEIKIDAQESVKIIGEDRNDFQQFVVGNLTPGGNTSLIGSGLQTITSGTGNAGDIIISTPDLMIDNGAGIISGTRSQGKSGNITIDVANTFAVKSSGLLTASGTFTLGEVGEIKIETDRLLVEQGGIISSSTLGDGNAGNLSVKASESIKIKETPLNSFGTGIFTNTIFGNGKGGNLTVNTPKLILEDGGQLTASSGAITSVESIPLGGKGGNITINDTESIIISGSSANGVIPSSIVSDTTSDNPAGNLTINTGNLLLRDNGLISASSIGSGTGGNITITAKDTVDLDGPGISNLEELIRAGLARGQLNSENIQGGIVAFTIGDGTAGTINLKAANLNLNNGAIVSTSTYGNDNAGDLTINVSEMIDVRGSAIISPTLGAGDGGTLELTTKDLSITEGGAIASVSLGSGNAGNLSILAKSIFLSDTIPDLLFSGSISTGSYGGVGLSGDLRIQTEHLSLKNGANIQANNDFPIGIEAIENILSRATTENTHGSLNINASESIEVFGSRVASEQNLFNSKPNSHISSTTTTSNPASNVFIRTKELSVLDNGEISVSSGGQGAAGELAIFADSVTLRNEATLNGTTTSGQGGDIILNLQDLLRLENNSVINTDALNSGNGGNIRISADFVIASGNSSISANAAAIGNGGSVDISAKDLFLTADSTITADSNLGIDGTVEIDVSVDTERDDYTELPQQVLSAETNIVQHCGNNDSQSVFSYTGRGGLPFNPLIALQANDIVIADFDIPHDLILNQFTGNNKMLNINTPELVEANQLLVNKAGKIELVATDDNNIFVSRFNPTNCPLSSYK